MNLAYRTLAAPILCLFIGPSAIPAMALPLLDAQSPKETKPAPPKPSELRIKEGSARAQEALTAAKSAVKELENKKKEAAITSICLAVSLTMEALIALGENQEADYEDLLKKYERKPREATAEVVKALEKTLAALKEKKIDDAMAELDEAWTHGNVAYIALEGGLFKSIGVGSCFNVRGSKACMTGIIDERAVDRFREMLRKYPKVKTIVMLSVQGSEDFDGESVFQLGRLIRQHGLNTHVPSGGAVSSGGTDLFCAGVERTAGAKAEFGVHDWDEYDPQTGKVIRRGNDLPANHKAHRGSLRYFKRMGIPQEFYFFTLKAAPPEEVHIMTPEELRKYKLLTGKQKGK